MDTFLTVSLSLRPHTGPLPPGEGTHYCAINAILSPIKIFSDISNTIFWVKLNRYNSILSTAKKVSHSNTPFSSWEKGGDEGND